jgi:hypothetical protein
MPQCTPTQHNIKKFKKETHEKIFSFFGEAKPVCKRHIKQGSKNMPRVGNTLHFEPNTKMQNIILSSVGKM